jgi:hypothetical protein
VSVWAVPPPLTHRLLKGQARERDRRPRGAAAGRAYPRVHQYSAPPGLFGRAGEDGLLFSLAVVCGELGTLPCGRLGERLLLRRDRQQ